MNTTMNSRGSGSVRTRGGVVLLIMLGMLALFTLIAATFVISAGHFRRGASSASKAEQTGDAFEVLLQQALMQVVRGSNNPQSVIGPHSLLEDLYGEADSVAGLVVETSTNPVSGAVDMTRGLDFSAVGGPALDGSAALGTRASFYPRNTRQQILANNRPQDFSPMLLEFSAVGFGWDKEPGVALVDDDQNGVIDDVSEVNGGDDAVLGSTYAHPVTVGSPPGLPASAAWASKQLPNGAPLPIIDNVDNYYAGRVITFLSGEAAGKSSHIVRSKAVPLNADSPACVTMLWVQPLYGDVRPTTRDRFIINGRAFNGTGFGYSPYQDNAGGNLQGKTDIRFLRRLDMGYVNTVGGADPLVGVPIALLPNPTDPGYREYLQAAAPLVDADEDYDAPDFQNMMLSYRSWNASRQRYETIMPSLHRPDLVNYFVRNLGLTTWTQLPPKVRRRIILRPEPADHYDYTQESTLDPEAVDGWNPAESFTDSNRNGQWDPGEAYVDANNNNGYDTGDRTFAGNVFDPVLGPWDVDNDGDGNTDSIWVDLGMPVTTLADGRAVKPLFAILVSDLDGRLNLNAHGSPGHYMRTTIPTNPLDPPPDDQPTMGSTEERYLLGGATYYNAQNSTSNTYSPLTGTPTRQGLEHYNVNTWITGSTAETAYATRYLYDEPSYGKPAGDMFEPPMGNGYSVADVNLAALFVRRKEDLPTLPQSRATAPTQYSPRFNRYRFLLEGTHIRDVRTRPTTSNDGNLRGTNFPQVLGRYGEYHLMTALSDPLTANHIYPGINSGAYPAPRAGLTDGGVVIPGARLSLAGDDDSPGAPTPFRNGGGPADQVNAAAGPTTALVPLGNTRYDALVLPDNSLNMRSGVYATPGDPDANGFIGLDLAGQPIYQNMGTAGETVNEPWEINLVNRYKPRARNNAPISTTTAEIDGSFTPGEMAHVLHLDHQERATYENRLRLVFQDDGGHLYNDLAFGTTTEQWDIPCPHIAPTAEMADALRILGLPLNNPSLGDLLRARFFLAHGSNPSNVHQVGLFAATRLATVSMRSYRFHGQSASASSNDDVAAGATIPEGWQTHFNAARLTKVGLKRKNTRLISPDLIVGLRMNVNAPLGNGYDDDGDFVVDEPSESIDISKGANLGPQHPTQPLWSGKGDPILPGGTNPTGGGYNQFANGGLRCDSNRDGNHDGRMDEMAHQQQAKELYCLMMLLMDQNYVIPAFERQISYNATNQLQVGAEENPQTNFTHAGFSLPNGIVIPTHSRAHPTKAAAWLTARQIAQWAINAVDFRDRDSIMTPFEFDVDPFFDNDGDCTGTNSSNLVVERPSCNGTWDVDGLVTDDPVDQTTGDLPDSRRPWRGIVWGCEYPDLVLTETLAFHDRRTQNLEADTTPTDPAPMTRNNGYCLSDSTGRPIGLTTQTCDPHWDQVRMPQGSLFVELYATGNPHLALNNSTTVESALPRELYTADGRLNLSKVVSGSGRINPVWRLAITQAFPHTDTSHPNNIAWRAARKPSTCSFNPFETYGVLPGGQQFEPNFNIVPPGFTGNGPDYQPVTVDRIVAFCAEQPTLNAAPETVFQAQPPDVFYYQDRTDANRPVLAAPGDYIVAGPHRRAVAPVDPSPNTQQERQALQEREYYLDNITTIGSTITFRQYDESIKMPADTRFQPYPLAYATPSSTPVAETDPATQDNYRQPPPLIDLGFNTQMGVIRTFTEFTTSTLAPRGEKRHFTVTNISGVDEYPRTTRWPVSSFMAIRQTSTIGQVSVTQGLQITRTTLVNYPATTLSGQVSDTCLYPQIRRPIVVPCAITRTAANLGQPIGMNISEPRVMTGVHQATYANPLPTGIIQGENTVVFSDTNLATRDTWRWADTAQDPPPPPPPMNSGPCPDVPFDGYRNGPLPANVEIRNPEFQAMDIKHLRNETYLGVKTVFLQRLADPTRIWNSDSNPYITLDWMPIDLTIFNGESQKFEEGKSMAMHTFDPDNPPFVDSQLVDTAATPTRVRFGTRQRGTPARPYLGRYSNFDLWSQPNWLETNAENMTNWYAGPPPTKKVLGGPVSGRYFLNNTGTGFSFQHPLQHTLGYLNVGYHVNRLVESLTSKPTLTSAAVRRPFVRPLGSRPAPNVPFSPSNTWDVGWHTGHDLFASAAGHRFDLALYVGSPRRPFAWLAWNNRPYASAMELMMVPCTGPSRLFHDYDMRRTSVYPFTTAAPVANPGIAPLGPTTPQGSANPSGNPMFLPDERRRSANEYLPYQVTGAETKFGYTQAPPFHYLLNFFTSSVSTPALASNLTQTSSPRKSDIQPNFYRIFEFLTVPSKFAGTQQMHLHGRYTSGGGFQGIWNNAMFYRTPTSPQVDLLIANTPAGAPNPGQLFGPIAASEYEHPGWPFTAPNNMISAYREPGRVNVNTIPVMSGPAQRDLITGLPKGGDKQTDHGAMIWRGVINEFFPALHTNFVSSKHQFGVSLLNRRGIDVRDGYNVSASHNSDWETPSDDYIDNFFAMYSGMRSDWPAFDIRGRNAAWEGGGGDDLASLPNDQRLPAPGSRTEHFTGTYVQRGRMDPQKPAWIANPIRSFLFDYSAVVPQFNFPSPYMNPLPQSHESAYLRSPYLAIDGTLMRRKDTTWLPWILNPWDNSVSGNAVAGNTGSGDSINHLPQSAVHIDPVFDPLFALNFPRPSGQGISGQTLMMYDPESTGEQGRRARQWMKSADYRNSDRNPFFRYQLYTKLGSVVTTRSNVYAIWITMAMFECERVGSTMLPSQNGHNPGNDYPMPQRFPDGFRILREVGGDTGEMRRHKIFAIFDRSIPVGFKRGENYNVDRAFLVRHIAY